MKNNVMGFVKRVANWGVSVIGTRILFPRPHNATKTPLKGIRLSNGLVTVGLEEFRKVVACIHVTKTGNSKTGKGVQSFSLSINHSCRRDCECYHGNEETKGKALCYGCKGHFIARAANIISALENTRAMIDWSEDRLVDEILNQILPDTVLFRWLVIGDITSTKMINVMARVAIARPDVKFWAYTKKYTLVNHWLDNNEKPENLNILFSEWGLEMDNRHNLPLSIFVPFGTEGGVVVREGLDKICPCSDPTWKGTCVECGQCATVKKGGHVYLYEHSTKKSAKRDSEVRKARKALA